MAASTSRTGVAPREVEREGRRILALLERPGAIAVAVGTRMPGEPTEVEVQPGRGRNARTNLKIVAGFLARDWIEPDGEGRWRISEAGSAWLRRGAAGQEPFRAQHQEEDVRLVETGQRTLREVRVNATESPLGWLRGRRDSSGASFLSPEEFEAGERLRRDFTTALMMRSVTANWDAFHLPRETRRGAAPSSGADISDIALAARQRYDAALVAIGPEMSGLLVDVCCQLVGLEDAERARQWPRRSGKVVVRLALALLARHYGLVAPQAAPLARRSHRWGREGYRPAIDGGASGGAG